MDDMNRFVQDLQKNPSAVRALMQSPDGQALLHRLSGNDGGASLQRAARSAMRGDASEMTQMIRDLMSSPDGARLVERIRKAAER